MSATSGITTGSNWPTTSPTPGRGRPVVIRCQGLPVALESAMKAVSAGSSIGWVSAEVSRGRAGGDSGLGALTGPPQESADGVAAVDQQVGSVDHGGSITGQEHRSS